MTRERVNETTEVARLTISFVGALDFRSYRCSANSSMGRAEDFIQLFGELNFTTPTSFRDRSAFMLFF